MNQGWVYREQVTRRDAGRSLLDYYSQRYPHSSRDEWQARIDVGQILVDGQRSIADMLLQAGQRLTYHRPPWGEPDVPLEFDVLHEDADVLVISKPSGLPVLPGGGFLQHTLLAQVQRRYPNDMPTPVHRLGRGTSGLMIWARSPRAKSSLSQQMRNHTQQAHDFVNAIAKLNSLKPVSNDSSFDEPSLVKQYAHLHAGWYTDDCALAGYLSDRTLQKSYLALIDRSDLPDQFSVTQPIGKLSHPVLGYVYGAVPDGMSAYSEGRVLRRERDRTLVDMTIFTGRPHQIRIHLASVGYPLLGDPLYTAGGVPHSAIAPPAEKLPVPGDCGYSLHAHQLTFRHPATGQMMTFTQAAPFE